MPPGNRRRKRDAKLLIKRCGRGQSYVRLRLRNCEYSVGPGGKCVYLFFPPRRRAEESRNPTYICLDVFIEVLHAIVDGSPNRIVEKADACLKVHGCRRYKQTFCWVKELMKLSNMLEVDGVAVLREIIPPNYLKLITYPHAFARDMYSLGIMYWQVGSNSLVELSSGYLVAWRT